MKLTKTNNRTGKSTTLFGCSGCGCLVVFLIINFTLGAWCFDYCLNAVFGKDVSWGLDLLGGLVLGEITIPATIILAICHAAGVGFPLMK